MVKIKIKLDNKTYATLAKMSVDSGMDVNELINLFIINRTEDYLEKQNHNKIMIDINILRKLLKEYDDDFIVTFIEPDCVRISKICGNLNFRMDCEIDKYDTNSIYEKIIIEYEKVYKK